MTDRELAAALVHAGQLEDASREQWHASHDAAPDRDAALVVMRHTIALKRALEHWIGARAIRATLMT